MLRLCRDMITTLVPKVSQGWNGDVLVPQYLFSLFNNLIEIIHVELTEVVLDGSYNEDLLAKRKVMMDEIMGFVNNVTSMLLTTQVANEKPYVFQCGMTNFTGERVLAENIHQRYGGEYGYKVTYPENLLIHLPPNTELFQTLDTAITNPFLWGFTDGLRINSYVAAPKFSFTNGTHLTVQDLPRSREFEVSCERSLLQDPDFWTALKERVKETLSERHNITSSSAAYSYTSELVDMPSTLSYTSVVSGPKTHTSSPLSAMPGLDEGGILGFEVTVTIFQPNRNTFPHDELGNVYVYIGIGYRPHKYMYDYSMNVTLIYLDWTNPADAVWSEALNWFYG